MQYPGKQIKWILIQSFLRLNIIGIEILKYLQYVKNEA